MPNESSGRRARYELTAAPAERTSRARGRGAGLPENLLSRSELWFCRFRWLVVLALLLFGGLSLLPAVFPALGFQAPLHWPLIIGAGLALINLLFSRYAHQVDRHGPNGAKTGLWAQIVVDLLVLTAVVHYAGSLETYIAFAYLFHIVLSCIFFPRLHSLGVTALAGVLYVGCVGLELAGTLPPAGVYAERALRQSLEQAPGTALIQAGSAIAIWLVVWYLTSTLSEMVRQRDAELQESNRRLLEARRERTRHMLRTAHELKSPLATVAANADLLVQGYCGELSEKGQEVAERISRLCRRLGSEVQEMLQLANITSRSREGPEMERLDLAPLIRKTADDLENLALKQKVTIEKDLQEAHALADREQIEMLLENLLSNAIFYSNEGGTVRLTCEPLKDGGALMTVDDEGIGIPEEKIPRIFEEYYRTQDAVRHHKNSTGLGLSIVHQVAKTHGLQVSVESAPGEGTKFYVRFPAEG